MIYLISIDIDNSTSLVLEWLYKEGYPFLRINNIIYAEKNFGFLPTTISNLSNNTSFGRKMHHSIWFRKLAGFEDTLDKKLKNFYLEASVSFIEFLLDNQEIFKNRIGLSSFGIRNNKLNVLSAAKEFKLTIPETLITNSKSDLLQFHSFYKSIITKPIFEMLTREVKRKQMITYTKPIDKKFINTLPDVFPTSLFQEYIHKEFDIRIFYMDGKLYPMAIFSQRSKKTSIDFRNYNFVRPNRCVPYKLPNHIENRLIQFMKEYKYEVASIDMVKCSKTGGYYFLEVNPYGQFEMVSAACNYYLEKKVALILSRE